jgi:hypothetical protein
MNHPKDTALIAPFRNVETTVKTLAAESAVSTERAARRRGTVFRRPSHRGTPRSGHREAIVTMTEENHGRKHVAANGD